MSDQHESEIEDDDDWVEIEREAKAGAAPRWDVQVKVSTPGKREKFMIRAKCYLAFRGDAAKWIEDHPHYRVRIGGTQANKIRLTPDNARGKYGSHLVRGVALMQIGVIACWPHEGREPTEAKWKIEGGDMILTLPATWAVAMQKAPPSAPKPPTSAPAPVLAPGMLGRRGTSA